MSYMTIDAVTDSGEELEILVARESAPEFGQEFEHEDPERGKIRVKRVPSIIRRPLVARYECKSIQHRRWHPAFRHHDKDGFGICTSKRDVRAALDWSAANATTEDEVWTFNDKEQL